MCHFITATLPVEADLNRSEEIFKAHRLSFRQTENESVREYLEKGDLYILTTKGMCDCGTVLASQCSDDEGSDEIDVQKSKDRALEKLKAKGWSASKIARWQKEQDLSAEREKMQDRRAHENSLTRVEDWVNFIHDLLSSKATKRIGILVHEYSGGLDKRIKILGKQCVSLKDLTPKLLVEMREDVMYDFIL